MHSWLTRWSVVAIAVFATLCATLAITTPVFDDPVIETAPPGAIFEDQGTDTVEGDTRSPADVPESELPEAVATEATEVAVSDDGSGALDRKKVDPFRMVGVTWERDVKVTGVNVKLQVREDGSWSDWYDLEVEDSGVGRPGTEPLWVSGVGDGVAVKVESATGVPADVQVTTIDPDAGTVNSSPASAQTEATTSNALWDPSQGTSTTSTNTSLPMPTIIPRSAWGAGPGTKCSAPTTMPKALGVVLHHTAGSNTAKKSESESIIRGYQTYHVGAHGWCDIGYAFLVDRWGQIFEGRKGGITNQVRGAHAGIGAVNQHATGVAMMGSFHLEKVPTAMQDAVVRLIAWRLDYFGANPNGTYTAGGKRYDVINGHRNVVSTECPGKYGYEWLNASGGLRDRVAAMIGEGSTKPATPTGIAPTSASETAVTIGWEAVPDAAQYRVVWRPDPAKGKANIEFVDSPEIRLTDLTKGGKYVIGVSAVSADGVIGDRSPLESFTTASGPPPATPTDIAPKTLSENSATIGWKAVSGATKYRVIWRPDPAQGSATEVFVNSPEITLTGLESASDYVIAVTAMDSAGQTSTRSPLTSFTTRGAVPAMPTGIAPTSTSDTAVTIGWNAVPGAKEYRVVWRSDPQGSATTVFVSSPSIRLTGLKPSSNYVIAVSSVDEHGQRSTRSPLVPFKTAAVTPPAMPTGIAPKSTSADAVTMGWNAVPGAVKYRVVWRTEPTKGTAEVVFVNDPEIRLTGLAANSDYVIAVSAVNSADQTSTRSPLVKFTTAKAGPPAMPTGIAPKAVTASSATIGWNEVANAEEYRVVWRPEASNEAVVEFVPDPEIKLTGLEAATDHVIAVSAVDEDGVRSTRSPLETFTTASAGPPAEPTGIAPKSTSATAVTMGWNTVPGAVKYRVVWRVEPTEGTAEVVFVDDPEIRLTGLDAGSDYVIAVSAVNSADQTSTRSPLVKFTTANDGPPSVPTGIAPKATSATAVTMGWNAVPGAVKYRVVWRPNPAEGAATIVTVTDPEIRLTGLGSGNYVIGVSAINAAGDTGKRSSLVTFRTSAATASFKDSITVPSSRKIVFKGHGYGHGIGMSQHGALGAARQGVKYDKILAHYYPGTKLGTITGDIRVQLTKVTNSEVKIVAANGLKFRKMSNNSVITLPTTLNGGAVTHWNIIPRTTNKAQSTLRYKVGSKWYNHSHFNGAAQFEGPSSLQIYHPNGTKHAYRGAQRSVPSKSGATNRHAVNVLDIEQYVKGVVAREMPSGWDLEALKAQSVAARTYGAQAIRGTGTYDICDTTSCQVYGGVAAEASRSNQAVEGTKGRIVTYQNKPAFTQFSSSSGGWTNVGSQPYLKPVRDDWDNFSGNSVHNWNLTVNASTIEKKYPTIGMLKSMNVTKRNGYGDAGGRVVTLRLTGSKGTKSISGVDARWAFGMRSDWFGF